mmetsp:Transcript_43880/g.44369  ORF Transcript_43880/g.44369 Transcript_43880/m.44369 type:complete len:94 (-) Transcript_43880:324-605(-)
MADQRNVLDLLRFQEFVQRIGEEARRLRGRKVGTAERTGFRPAAGRRCATRRPFGSAHSQPVQQNHSRIAIATLEQRVDVCKIEAEPAAEAVG